MTHMLKTGQYHNAPFIFELYTNNRMPGLVSRRRAEAALFIGKEKMQATVKIQTIAKQSTAQASTLAPKFKTILAPGKYEILRWVQAEGNHQKITFAKPVAGFQTWLVWGDDVDLPGEDQNILLKVPYYSQRDNGDLPRGEWFRTCNSSTHAMLANYLKPGCLPGGDREYLEHYVLPGDTIDWDVHTQALKRLGIVSEYRQNLDYEELENSLKRGYPVPIGVLHKGNTNAPSGGHVLLIIGMDKARDIFIANDPWGAPFSYDNHNGQRVEIPVNPSLDKRWLVDGSNSGWGRIVTRVN